MENKNEEYAQLLELLAKKIKETKEPISKEVVSDIEKLSKDIIEPKRKTLIISDAAKNGIKGTKVLHQEETPEYRKIVEEANKRIEEDNRKQAEAIINANNYIAR